MAAETIEQNLTRYLRASGLQPHEATGVMSAFKTSEIRELMQDRWNDPVCKYPPAFTWALISRLGLVVILWIDENASGHSARATFAGHQYDMPPAARA